MTTLEISTLQEEVRALAAEREAVILAHNYQVPEVQDVADFVGDSLGLSREAAATDAEAIVFCGVHFMAETASILAPDKTVLIPDLDAGCSLAASITADQLRAWKAEHPGGVVVSYVNTTAEVKAESDYCCTSGNAKAVIEAIPEDQEILFLPDLFLGVWLERATGRKLKIWMGECHVHAGIRPADIERWQDEAPDAELLVHPECGCASQCMAFGNERTHILSTEGMINFAKSSPKKRFLVATETGILHRLNKEAPEKRFEAISEKAICKYMKMITLEKLRDSLRDWKHVVTVEPGDRGARPRRDRPDGRDHLAVGRREAPDGHRCTLVDVAPDGIEGPAGAGPSIQAAFSLPLLGHELDSEGSSPNGDVICIPEGLCDEHCRLGDRPAGAERPVRGDRDVLHRPTARHVA